MVGFWNEGGRNVGIDSIMYGIYTIDIDSCKPVLFEYSGNAMFSLLPSSAACLKPLFLRA